MPFTYIIEHMEEDEGSAQKIIPEWVQLEYSHMRSFAGPSSRVAFTSLSRDASASLSVAFEAASNTEANAALAKASICNYGILQYISSSSESLTLEEVCLLDPRAETELSPEDGDGRFKCFLFGGILGDDPPRDRTAELRVLGFPSRRLGPVQMTTDTALGVTKTVVEDKVPLNNIPYIDFPTITFNAKESVEMPFRYISKNGEPLLPPGMRELLHKDLNKSFEF
ncbi:DUF431-domain-containing protein [Sistotremastrum niveocremeum HHB9708]|uniref:DUF431-domain-containing protein n=2 Tax=Sistotremastraceae TaxID=3402574 RepID=A0A164YHR7_9AGAM|nr:DUF431-domain-containing protein [Sistotremastrum niveocremeum HHB9708]KZT43346.1 DUF431-domain-containing protein [Sistotremastrum suecicum HHB10207 ss-3]